MGRWGVLIILAVLGFNATAKFGQVTPRPSGIGTFSVQISNFNASITYERDPQLGDYSQTHLNIDSLHSIEATGGGLSNSSPEAKLDQRDLGADQLIRLQVFRRGKFSELQWYILNWDQTTQRLTPSIEKRTIALVSGTWEGFEKGQEVTAEIVDDQGYLDSIKIFYGLAESYYNMVYLPMIKETKFQTDAPMISVEKPKRAQVLISSQRIVVMQQADQVRIKTNIFPPNK